MLCVILKFKIKKLHYQYCAKNMAAYARILCKNDLTKKKKKSQNPNFEKKHALYIGIL